MRIVFFGSDDFAAVHLELLLARGHQLLACVTGPDRPQGRGMKIVESMIKQIATTRQIPCVQPVSLKDKDCVSALKKFEADIFVVVAYGRLLTQEILNLPKMLCLNVHGSLLPQYRGAAPVNWTILNGDKETGVTIQKMVLALDAGDIVAQKKLAIEDSENAADLRKRMALVGAQLLADILDKYPKGLFPLMPQDESGVTYAPKLTKEMGRIDWNQSAVKVKDQVRGLQPWPGAYTAYKGKMLKITKLQITTEISGKFTRGQVIRADKNGLYVACLDKIILVTEVQPEAGKLMPAASFAAGSRITPGALFQNSALDR